MIGAALIWFLVMPSRYKGITEDYNRSLAEYSEQLSSGNVELNSMESEIKTVKAEKESLEQQLSELNGTGGGNKLLISVIDGITKNHISAAPITTPTRTLTIVIAPLLGSLYDDLGSITSLPLRGLLSSSFTFFLGKKLPDISLSLIFWLWFICSRYLLARVLFLSILSTEFRSFLAL